MIDRAWVKSHTEPSTNNATVDADDIHELLEKIALLREEVANLKAQVYEAHAVLESPTRRGTLIAVARKAAEELRSFAGQPIESSSGSTP
jgi:uncharacterized small protein (DUF1192 family)